jgi:pyrrolidone-carboxylate peptidase
MASHSMQAQAYNEATFREPDEDGWQPQHEPIDTHPGCSPDTCLHTRLPLQRVLGKLF